MKRNKYNTRAQHVRTQSADFLVSKKQTRARLGQQFKNSADCPKCSSNCKECFSKSRIDQETSIDFTYKS